VAMGQVAGTIKHRIGARLQEKLVESAKVAEAIGLSVPITLLSESDQDAIIEEALSDIRVVLSSRNYPNEEVERLLELFRSGRFDTLERVALLRYGYRSGSLDDAAYREKVREEINRVLEPAVQRRIVFFPFLFAPDVSEYSGADGFSFQLIPGTSVMIGTGDPGTGIWVLGRSTDECRRAWEILQSEGLVPQKVQIEKTVDHGEPESSTDDTLTPVS